jgi:broad specificity phosphatase PhoE
MTKFRIKLIRHGEKKLFLPNPGLTELGRSQVENLAKNLALHDKPAHSKKTLLLSSPQHALKKQPRF